MGLVVVEWLRWFGLVELVGAIELGTGWLSWLRLVELESVGLKWFWFVEMGSGWLRG